MVVISLKPAYVIHEPPCGCFECFSNFKCRILLRKCRQDIKNADEAGQNALGLFCRAFVRLVEDKLADLDCLDVFRGPTGGCFPLMEIQCATGSVR